MGFLQLQLFITEWDRIPISEFAPSISFFLRGVFLVALESMQLKYSVFEDYIVI